jgi:hypothetical protein
MALRRKANVDRGDGHAVSPTVQRAAQPTERKVANPADAACAINQLSSNMAPHIKFVQEFQ